MPRSGRVERRPLEPDAMYNSRLVTRLINRVMIDGKKTIAQSLVYKAFEAIEKQGKNPLTIFETAMANISPKMEVKPRRIGGASYQVPVEVRGDRREALSLRWLIAAARSRANKEFHTFNEKLAVEIVEAAENRGAAIKKKEDMQRSAEANKAFAHFRM